MSTNQTNITGTLNVLIAAKDNKVRKVIFASSSSVYGETPTLPKIEDMIANPQSPYGLTKLVGEYYCRIFEKIYHLSCISLRYFNIYGPRQNPNSEYAAVIPRFISLVSQNKSPVIYGDGKQTRDFTFVRDAVQANIIAAETNATGVYNVGTGENTTLNRLAKIIIKLMDRELNVTYQDPKIGDIRDSLADISRTKNIGYKPRYKLEDGLKETIRMFKSAI
jgi:UDP-glucose 4-epimerase